MQNRTRLIMLGTDLMVAASPACRAGTTKPRSTETPVPARSPTRDPTVMPRPSDAGEAGHATWTRPADGIEIIYIPAGELRMGSTDDEVDEALDLCSQHFDGCERDQFADEQPAHTARLDALWIDHTEVTNAQYGLCATHHPVVGVDWHRAASLLRVVRGATAHGDGAGMGRAGAGAARIPAGE